MRRRNLSEVFLWEIYSLKFISFKRNLFKYFFPLKISSHLKTLQTLQIVGSVEVFKICFNLHGALQINDALLSALRIATLTVFELYRFYWSRLFNI